MVLALGLFPFEIRELMSSESIKASFSKLLWTAFAGRSALWLYQMPPKPGCFYCSSDIDDQTDHMMITKILDTHLVAKTV